MVERMASIMICDIPSEILSNIFGLMVELPFHPFGFRSSLRDAIRDLVSVSHVDSHFREVAIYDPSLWAMLALVNGIHEDLFEAILIRSMPLPFCLSFLEDETLPSDSDTKAWMLALDHVGRLGHLSIEVAEGFEGVYAKSVLTTARLPALQRCIVQFHGLRNIRLDSKPHPLFANAAPRLQSLDLTNCYAFPSSRHFPKLRSMAVRYTGPPHCAPRLPSFHACRRWNVQLRNLHTLIIWNCFAHPRSLVVKRVKLPLLESLTVAVPLSFCRRVAESLEYPADCACNITVLFPRLGSPSDAESGALSAIAFLSLGEYPHCTITMDGRTPTIRLIRLNGRTVVLRFNFDHLIIPIRQQLGSFRRAINALPSSAAPAALDPLHVFCFGLWDTLATALSTYVELVRTLRISIPHKNLPDLIYLPPLLTAMPVLRSISFEQPAVFGESSFLYISTLHRGLSQLQQVTIRVTEEGWSKDMKYCLADFLKSRVNRGAPVQEVLFVVPPRLVQTLGFASMDGVRLILADISEHFPPCVAVRWLER